MWAAASVSASKSSPSPTPSPSSSAEPSPGIGLPTQREFTGPWLSQQLALTLSFGLLSLLSFSLLVKRRGWRDYLAPIGRPDSARGADDDADDEHIARKSTGDNHRLHDGRHTRIGRFLCSTGLEWLATTLYTSDVAAAHLSGPPTSSIDTLTLLDFFRFGTKLFAALSVWTVCVLMPVNWRENGWLDGVKPSDEKPVRGRQFVVELLRGDLSKPEPEPLPVPPGPPDFSSVTNTTLYDSAHLITLVSVGDGEVARTTLCINADAFDV